LLTNWAVAPGKRQSFLKSEVSERLTYKRKMRFNKSLNHAG
jgi:hypothetical protein